MYSRNLLARTAFAEETRFVVAAAVKSQSVKPVTVRAQSALN